MQKYNIFFSAERPSLEEIEVHKDFDKVLQQHKSALLYGKLVKAGISLVSVAGLVGAFMLFYPTPAETAEADQTALVTTAKETLETRPLQPLAGSLSEEQTPLASAGTSEAALSVAPAPQARPEEDNQALARPAKEKWVAGEAAPAPAKAGEAKPADKPNRALFVKPEPAAGYKALQEYFARDMKHPQGEAPDRVSGIVLVSFAIDEQGKPEDIEIEKKLHEACDAEAIRLVENMPPWKPATIDGKVVKTRLAVPVRF